jgi:hypothetical protein
MSTAKCVPYINFSKGIPSENPGKSRENRSIKISAHNFYLTHSLPNLKMKKVT